MRKETIPRVLTIAGSDSGGGAGIQADLKTFNALGCYGASAVTSVTTQNTTGVFSVHDVPPDHVRGQIGAVLDDIGADAAKIGMLSTADIILAVSDALNEWPVEKLVLDPVMVAKSGDALLQPSAQQALMEHILPLALVITPNVPEAQVLTGTPIEREEDAAQAAEILLGMGPRYVLIKGGHMDGPEAMDYLFTEGHHWTYAAPRIETKNTHGTGCTFSAAIASFLALGKAPEDAVGLAKEYLHGAIENALPLGKGHGPLNHMWRL